MKIYKSFISLAIVFSLLLTYSIPANSSGGLIVNNGTIATYKGPLIYRLDEGTLGKFSSAEAIKFIEDSFATWQGVNSSTLTFQKDNPASIGTDINETNFNTVLSGTMFNGFTPVVFDTDGMLTDALLGAGAGNGVLGFAGPLLSQGSTTIMESQIVFNGKFVDGIANQTNFEDSETSFKATILHEIGHSFNLDHSQINVEASQPSASQSVRDSVPLMYPTAVNDLFGLKRDDISSISLLYPNSSQLGGFGIIEGRVLRDNCMTPVQGANVIARNVSNPSNEAVSNVSDFLNKNTGEFKLFGLPPGDYRIEIEPISTGFTGGSSVGPFAQDTSDKAFQNPVPKGFATGAGGVLTTSQGSAAIFMVTAGQTTTGIDIVATTQNVSCAVSSTSTSGGTSSSSTTSGGTTSSTSSTSSSSTSSTSGGTTTSSSTSSTSGGTTTSGGTSTSGGTGPSVSISGSNTINIGFKAKRNQTVLNVDVNNVDGRTRCFAFSDGDFDVKVRPRRLKFTPNMTSRRLRVRVPRFTVNELLDEGESVGEALVVVECDNDTEAEFTVDLDVSDILKEFDF